MCASNYCEILMMIHFEAHAINPLTARRIVYNHPAAAAAPSQVCVCVCEPGQLKELPVHGRIMYSGATLLIYLYG